MMRTIPLTVGKEWVDLKAAVKYASGDMILFNNHISTNILLVESDIKPNANDRGVILSGYGQSRSAFNLPANTGNVYARSEDGLSVELMIQTQ
ncbi:hypothetical protein HLBENOHH_02462 [Aeromonas dhakensis]|uniref:hypothetical protein n=1 Tax=Aeromonas dhakensis TaxID=196024 RepID=UPI00366CAACA